MTTITPYKIPPSRASSQSNLAVHIERICLQNGRLYQDKKLCQDEELCQAAYENDASVDEEEELIINHEPNPLPIPTLSIGGSLRYLMDNHIENGTLVGIDLTSFTNPTIYGVEFNDGRKVF